MTMPWFKYLWCVVLCALSFQAQAWSYSTEPIATHQNLAIVTGSGTVLKPKTVKHVIELAADKRRWQVSKSKLARTKGSMTATLDKGEGRTIIVEITYTAKTYSVRYKNSTNMDYGSKDDVEVIHSDYNKWVRELLDGIRIELYKR